MKAFPLIFALVFLVPPAAAQMTPELSCRGDRADRGCEAARIRRQREVYDLPSLEQLRDDGVQVRRMFFWRAEEWSEWNIGVLLFERRPGHGPTVHFQLPRNADGTMPEPLVAELTEEAWREVLARSVAIDRRYVPLPNDQEVCMSGSDYTVETSDPADREIPATLRRQTTNACTDSGPARAYVLDMATLAERFFPACALLRFPGNTAAISRLPICAWLEGDRLAAAEVRNALTPFDDFSDATEAARLFDAFDMDAELYWNGTRTTGRRAVAEQWARNATQSDWPEFLMASIRGETGDRVRVRAQLDQGERVDNVWRHRRAPVEMIWLRRGDGRFYLRQTTVGAFAPYTPPAPQHSRPRPRQ